MKTKSRFNSTRGISLVEMMVAMSIGTMAIGLALGTFIFGFKIMYRDMQRLATNASLRSFTAQITKETLDASYFYLFDYYTKLDGSVNLDTDCATLVLDDATGTEYDKWVANGDCVVLVTNMVDDAGVTKIRQVRIYYRITVNQTGLNNNASLRYLDRDYGPSGTSSSLTTILNGINLNSTPTLSPSEEITDRCRGRTKPNSTDRYPIFSSESPSATPSNGFISINVEFVTGSSANNILSSSSFNYTISPRR